LLQALATDTEFVAAIASDSNLSQKDFEVIIHKHATTLQCSSLSTLSLQQLQSRILSSDINSYISHFDCTPIAPAEKSDVKTQPIELVSHLPNIYSIPSKLSHCADCLNHSLPPPDYIILERPDKPEPKPLIKKDYTCKKPAKFHKLVRSRLQYTVPADKSKSSDVLFRNKETNEERMTAVCHGWDNTNGRVIHDGTEIGILSKRFP
jgi:hypothetical protein